VHHGQGWGHELRGLHHFTTCTTSKVKHVTRAAGTHITSLAQVTLVSAKNTSAGSRLACVRRRLPWRSGRFAPGSQKKSSRFWGRRVPAALAGACAAAAISIPTEPALTLATARLPRWLCQNRDTPHLDNDLCGVDMTSAARALQAARASRIRDDLGNFETDVSRATCACSFVECTSLKWCNL